MFRKIAALKRYLGYALVLSLVPVLAIELCGCGSPQQEQAARREVHVAINGNDDSGNGTQDAPFATVTAAAESAPGSTIVMHAGDYGPIELGPECSGSEEAPTVIRPAEGEDVVIRAEGEIGVSLVNISHIAVEGLEIEGGTHGVYYQSTREAGQALTDIRISGCTVHGVRGTHGICVYARNDLAPVQNLTIEDCEVYDCDCGDSESMVLNGNVDGFVIKNNVIHDNNNIGIDMIGFEGTAKHPDGGSTKNAYEVDMTRNGICTGNVIYNISTEGNQAYFEDGEYDLSAGGIYVDGGQNIEISDNFIFNCDIGLEVATEHNPNDNELFRVSGIHVHDNVIADCLGYAGICFGGYDNDRGFTEECTFEHNTLVDNAAQIGIQRSKDNRVFANLVIGGDAAVEFSEEVRKEDMINDISGNASCEISNEECWKAEYGSRYQDRTEVADGFRSLIDDVGSRFVPDGELMKLYATHL